MSAVNSNPDRPLILVADDDSTVRMVARECLEESGFRVEEAENGEEALRLFSTCRPDSVMLDVLMPELDGYEVCRSIRARAGNENLPILMMTALDDVNAIHAAYQAGATEFTTKPINWTIEVHRLRSMLRAAEASRQVYLSKQEWERTFNALDEIVTIHNVDLTIVQANEAAVAAAQKPTETIFGSHCSEVLCSIPGGCTACPVMEVAATGEKKIIERESECMEGTYLVSAFPVFDDSGSLTRIVHMAKDITERQQLEAEMQFAQKMEAVGTLSGGLAHDFNNLLQVIIGYSDLVSQSFSPDDKAYQSLEAVKDAAWRGSEITRQLLTLSSKTEARKQHVLLNGVVNDVVKLLGRTIPKMIFIELALADDLYTVNADPAQIEQVLMNLAVNAKHAMPQGGRLHIETRNTELDSGYCRVHPNILPGRYVQLTVTDTGCGMSEETQARIFEPFFTTRSPDQGTGLGLAMVYGIVQKHQGHLLCYSEEGKGTSFKIFLPAAATPTTGDSGRPVSEDRDLAGGEEVILLVDDVAQIRHIAGKILAGAGYVVLLASDGKEALKVYAEERERIDFVILDLNMPVMGGLECLDELHERDPDLPVMLASGFALNDESEKKMGERVDYICKPYREKEFLLKIREMLDRRAVVKQ